MRFVGWLRSQVRTASEANANQPANAGAKRRQVAGAVRRLRAMTFDAWLFALMLAFVALAVSASLYVSFTSWRYVAEVIGGMPPNVATAVPIAIDGSVASGLLGEWWLAGRRRQHGLQFAYMVAFGLTFAVITILGNAAHGALALSVQRPVELLIGGEQVPLPWWVSIAVSAVPGLAIGGSGYAMALIVAVWRDERANAAPGEADESDDALADSQDDSQPRPPSSPRPPAKLDPRVLRIARAGGDWRRVAAVTGLGEHAAKRALTAARKQLASDSQDAPGGTGRDGVAA